MIRVVFELLSGPDRGRRLEMAGGQTIEVGRSEWAGWTVFYDPKVSGKHARIVVDHECCKLTDLGSSNGTFLNGERISEAVLKSGDRLQLGDSQFSVTVDGAAGDVPVAVQAFVESRKPRVSAEFTAERTETGLWRYFVDASELTPADLIGRLTTAFPCTLIVDFSKIGAPPEEPPPHDALFDWLPSSAAERSPWIVPARSWPKLAEAFPALWGKNAVVLLFTRMDPEKLAKQLRSAVRFGDGIVGICWPKVLAPMLQHFRGEFAVKLLSGIELVMLELPDEPARVQLFALAPQEDLLVKVGLKANKNRPPDAPAPPIQQTQKIRD